MIDRSPCLQPLYVMRYSMCIRTCEPSGGKMRSLLPIAISALLMIATGSAHAAAPLAISNQGWTITADGGGGALSISQQDLGIVLRDVRINLGDQNAILPLTGRSVEQTSQSQLTIHTVHP